MKLAPLAGLLAAGAVVVAIASAPFTGGAGSTAAERMALKIDAALDLMEEPEGFSSIDLELVWPFEIAPYFEYEGLTDSFRGVPAVTFQPQADGQSHNHLAGYTYCGDEVWLNVRYINWVSTWYNRPDSLGTLVHEMVHTLGGDFCSRNSERAESRTQLATLEVLAAMANHGNYYALYAVLDELRDVALSTVWAESIKANDLDRFRAFRERIFPNDAVREARFEKAVRYWSSDPGTLRAILTKYSVVVFNDLLDGEFEAVLPRPRSSWGGGTNGPQTVLLDDLMYVIEHAEEMATDSEEDK